MFLYILNHSNVNLLGFWTVIQTKQAGSEFINLWVQRDFDGLFQQFFFFFKLLTGLIGICMR